jgi:multisubunit Na+/H+ antiporter MnhC subunit
MDVASAGSLAAAAIGAVLLVLTLVDLFVTIFNYDGFTFLAGRLHRLAWRTLRASARVLPERTRRGYLSLGSAGMLPLTLVWWLAVEITAFALIFLPGLDSSGFALTHAAPGIGTAFYLSGGAISSLTFGDVTPTAPLFRALVDLETVIGLATFTLALTYVIAAFDALGTLNALHGRVRRHAIEPNRPETIVARYYHGGQPEELSGLLTSLSEDLEAYDQGLRRLAI